MADEQTTVAPTISAEDAAVIAELRGTPVVAADAVADEAALGAEVEAEATGEEAPAEEETPTEEESPTAKRFAAHAREERRIQRQREALKADQGRVVEADRILSFAKEFDAAFAKDPIEAISRAFKINEDRLAELLIARLEGKPSVPKVEAKSKDDDRIAALERQLADERAEKQKAAQQQREDVQLKNDVALVTDSLSADATDRWEFVKNHVDDNGLTGADLLTQMAKDYIGKNPGQGPRDPVKKEQWIRKTLIPTMADSYEETLIKQEQARLTRISKVKKLGVTVPPSPAGKATKPVDAKANSGTRTLTNKVNSAPPRPSMDKPAATREERLHQLLEGFEPVSR